MTLSVSRAVDVTLPVTPDSRGLGPRQAIAWNIAGCSAKRYEGRFSVDGARSQVQDAKMSTARSRIATSSAVGGTDSPSRKRNDTRDADTLQSCAKNHEIVVHQPD